MPLPFSRGFIAYGEPIRVARDSSRSVMEEKREQLQDSLHKLTERVDRLAETGKDS